MSTTAEIQTLMEQASEALARMDYLACESLALEALQFARQKSDWWSYGRILMPLQEARRQRRMIAMEGTIVIHPAGTVAQATQLLGETRGGVVVLAPPHTPADAQALASALRSDKAYAEVFFARPNDDHCMFVSTGDIDVNSQIDAPPQAWLDRPLDPSEFTSLARDEQQRDPAGWILAASEKLGDAAVAAMPDDLTLEDQVAYLERAMTVVTDHEIIHQTLFDKVRDLARQGSSASR